MARPMESSAKRPRISIDVQPEVRRRLRLAAAKRDLTIRQIDRFLVKHGFLQGESPLTVPEGARLIEEK